MQQDLESQSLEKALDNAIVGFSNKTGYAFLSNFYGSTLAYEGLLYPTVEHAYQAAKSLDIMTRRMFCKVRDPNIAKKMGQSIIVRPDWNDVKIPIMRILIREKFENPFIRCGLLETVGRRLINENKWNDRFWGVVNGEGENWLGKILEEVRDVILLEDSS
jgi:ribA/ribD-fused uncharacterized protein